TTEREVNPGSIEAETTQQNCEVIMVTPLTENPKADMLPSDSGAGCVLKGKCAPRPEDKDGKTWVRTSVIVQADRKKLYGLWRDVEAAPAWHERITEVRAT